VEKIFLSKSVNVKSRQEKIHRAYLDTLFRKLYQTVTEQLRGAFIMRYTMIDGVNTNDSDAIEQNSEINWR